ncbi:MAG: GNAT family N-acetyltransferase [Blautia sp.]
MDDTLIYRKIEMEELKLELFRKFQRRQNVDRQLQKQGDAWVERPVSLVEEWSKEDYEFLLACLQDTIREGGVVFGAFEGNAVKGFASVSGNPLGYAGTYRDLTSLHVSRDMRGRGIGTRLFHLAAGWALAMGGQKLYIAANPAIESQFFYRALGCTDAQEPDEEHMKNAPKDRQLEYVL